MNTIAKFIAMFCFSLIIAGCDEKLIKKQESQHNIQVDTPLDIYAFTKEFNNKQPLTALNPMQQKTVDEIINAYDLFLGEKEHDNYPLINTYAKKHDWEVNYYNDENYSEYRTKLNDGSGVSILFKHIDIKEYKIKEHKIYVWGLKEAQCNYLVNYYKYHEKIKTEVVKYRENPSGTSSQDSFCKDLNKEDGFDIAVHLKYTGKSFGKDYTDINKHLLSLFNKEFKELAKYANIYFTKEPVSNKIFRDDVEYAINEINGHITIGDITKIRCKEIIYDLPADIKYKINDGTQCSKDINTIEFFK